MELPRRSIVAAVALLAVILLLYSYTTYQPSASMGYPSPPCLYDIPNTALASYRDNEWNYIYRGDLNSLLLYIQEASDLCNLYFYGWEEDNTIVLRMLGDYRFQIYLTPRDENLYIMRVILYPSPQLPPHLSPVDEDVRNALGRMFSVVVLESVEGNKLIYRVFGEFNGEYFTQLREWLKEEGWIEPNVLTTRGIILRKGDKTIELSAGGNNVVVWVR